MDDEEVNTEFEKTLDGLQYCDHILLFVDILGYSQIVRYGEEKKKEAVLALQKKFLTSDMSGLVKKVNKSSNESTLSTKPLTALLSDTLVYSFPIGDLESCNHKTVITYAYFQLADYIDALHTIRDSQVFILERL